jgi:hypothetical protein
MKNILQYYWLTLMLQFDGSNMPKTLGGNILLAAPLIIISFLLDVYLGHIIAFFPKIILIVFIFSLLQPIARIAGVVSHTIILLLKFLLLLFGILNIQDVYSVGFLFIEITLFFILFIKTAKNSMYN